MKGWVYAVVLNVWKAPRALALASTGEDLAKEENERVETSVIRAGIFLNGASEGGGVGPS